MLSTAPPHHRNGRNYFLSLLEEEIKLVNLYLSENVTLCYMQFLQRVCSKAKNEEYSLLYLAVGSVCACVRACVRECDTDRQTAKKADVVSQHRPFKLPAIG
jgi:hypothetical protein